MTLQHTIWDVPIPAGSLCVVEGEYRSEDGLVRGCVQQTLPDRTSSTPVPLVAPVIATPLKSNAAAAVRQSSTGSTPASRIRHSGAHTNPPGA